MTTTDWMSRHMKEGLVSVIIPVYNRAGVILDTLQSVRSQRYQPIEIVVVDDGSTDESVAVISRWIEAQRISEDFSVRLVQQRSLGAPAARNHGLRLSRGEYIQFLDSDDALHPLKIARQVTALQSNPHRAAAYGQWRIVRKVNNRFAAYEPAIPLPEHEFLRQLIGKINFCVPHAFLWRRTAAQIVGPWDESLAADQDGDYALRHVLAWGAPLLVPESCCYYIGHGMRISADRTQRTFDSRMRVIDKSRNKLRQDGRLHAFAAELVSAYDSLARAYFWGYPTGAKHCLQKIESISGNFSAPGKLKFFGSVMMEAARKKIAVRTRIERLYRGANSKGYQGRKLAAMARCIEEIYELDNGISGVGH